MIFLASPFVPQQKPAIHFGDHFRSIFMLAAMDPSARHVVVGARALCTRPSSRRSGAAGASLLLGERVAEGTMGQAPPCS